MNDQEAPTPAGLPKPGVFEYARIAARTLSSLVGLRRGGPQASIHQGGEPPMGASTTVVSPDTLRDQRIPPRQVRTKKWPVLHVGSTPKVDLPTWDIQVIGLVDLPSRWTWDEFRRLPAAKVAADMHCVTRWSKLDNTWEGVLVSEVMRHVAIRPEAKFVLIHGDAGYTTNISLAEFLADDCLFAWANDGKPLDADHGAPLRLVVPRLYAWKSAKWVRKVEILANDRPGFWEQNGYHNHGDPWNQERFS